MFTWLRHFEERFGLLGKIALVFAAAAFLTVLVAVTAWQSFQQVVAAQRGIINEAMPAMDTAQKLASDNTRIIALMHQIDSVREVAQVTELQNSLDEQLADMRALLYRLEIRNLAPALSADLVTIVESINDNLQSQSRAAIHRLELGRDEQRLDVVQRQAALELSALSESLLSNASTASSATISNLYPLIGGGAEKDQIFDTLDRLIDVDVDRLERMSELQLTCFKLKTTLEQLGYAQSLPALDELRQRFTLNLSLLQRRLQDVSDPDRKASGLRYFQILRGGLEATGLFAIRHQHLQAQVLSHRLGIEGDLLAAKLNGRTSELVTAGGHALEAAGENSRDAINRGLSKFLFVAVLLLLSFVVTVWILFRHHVLRRLQGMESAVRALTTGNFDVRIAADDNDALAPLGRALENLRENALARRHLEAELLRHQQVLEDTVATRTMELQQSNVLLEREVNDHAVARRQAEDAHRAKNIFLGTLSHELRTPLSGVSGSVQLLEETRLDAQQQDYVRMIGYANAMLLDILEDMLSFSRLEAGKLEIDCAPFDLHQLISDMLALQGVPARTKSISLQADVADDVPKIVVGDRRKLNQILLNTIGNAIKFTDTGAVKLIVRLVAAAPGGPIKLSFVVRDTGIGIPADQCEAVFTPFLQVQNTVTRRHGGTGLGLAICQRLVEAMGGSIHMQSQLGQGSELTFYLEYHLAATEVPMPAPAVAALNRPARRLRVLVVEDDEINRIICECYLTALGHEAVSAPDGEQALALLHQRREPLDAVLMDISLPGISGPEVAVQLRQLDNGRWANLPIVAMSAHVRCASFSSDIDAEMAAFLQKPFDKRALAATLDQACQDTDAAVVIPVDPNSAEGGATGHADDLLDDTYLNAEVEDLGTPLLTELLLVFRGELEAALLDMDRARQFAEWQELGRRSHRLCSAASNLGMRVVQVQTRQLENAVKQVPVDPENIELLLSQLRDSAELSCKALGQKLVVAQLDLLPGRST